VVRIDTESCPWCARRIGRRSCAAAVASAIVAAQRHPRGETESWFGRSAFKVAGRPHDDESAYGVGGARQLAVVDSVAVVEEFEVVTDAMTQVHAMAVPRPGDKRDGL